jgi:hypothetical protein
VEVGSASPRSGPRSSDGGVSNGNPMAIPSGLLPEPFAGGLINVLRAKHERLVALHRDNNKGELLTVQGIEVFVSYAGEGTDLAASRTLSTDDGRELPEHFARLLGKKSGKIKEEKQAARETWFVVYNTFWTAMSPQDVREVVLRALTKAHEHIDHIGIVSGDPPDDAWVAWVR